MRKIDIEECFTAAREYTLQYLGKRANLDNLTVSIFLMDFMNTHGDSALEDYVEFVKKAEAGKCSEELIALTLAQDLVERSNKDVCLLTSKL